MYVLICYYYKYEHIAVRKSAPNPTLIYVKKTAPEICIWSEFLYNIYIYISKDIYKNVYDEYIHGYIHEYIQ